MAAATVSDHDDIKGKACGHVARIGNMYHLKALDRVLLRILLWSQLEPLRSACHVAPLNGRREEILRLR